MLISLFRLMCIYDLVMIGSINFLGIGDYVSYHAWYIYKRSKYRVYDDCWGSYCELDKWLRLGNCDKWLRSVFVKKLKLSTGCEILKTFSSKERLCQIFNKYDRFD